MNILDKIYNLNLAISTSPTNPQELEESAIFGLEKVGSSYGQDIFGSEDVNRRYLEAIRKQGVFKATFKNIEYLVNNKTIIVGFISKGILSLLLHKVSASKINKATVAFYDHNQKKVFILLDNKTKMLLWLDTQELSLATFHELMHLFCFSNPAQYFPLFLPLLIKFYRTFFLKLTNSKLEDPELQSWISFIFRKVELLGSFERSLYIKKITELFKKNIQTEEQREFLVDNVANVAYTFAKDPNLFIKLARKGQQNIALCLTSLFDSYEELGIFKPKTIPIQELFATSEVVCITSEKPTANHYKALSMIVPIK